MSVILYHQHHLVGDDRGIFDQNGWQERTLKMLKVWENAEKTMAFALCGQNDSRFNRAAWMVTFGELIAEREFERSEDSIPLEKGWQDIFGEENDKTLLIGTHRHLYIVSKKEIFQTYRDETLAFGNGARAAIFATRQGLNAKEAVELVVKVCADCGGNITDIDLRQLNPLPQKPRGRGKKK